MTQPDHPQDDEHRDDLPGPGVAAALAMLTRHLDWDEGANRRSHLPSTSADRSERGASITWREAPSAIPERASLATRRRWVETLDLHPEAVTRPMVATRSFRPGHPLP